MIPAAQSSVWVTVTKPSTLINWLPSKPVRGHYMRLRSGRLEACLGTGKRYFRIGATLESRSGQGKEAYGRLSSHVISIATICLPPPPPASAFLHSCTQGCKRVCMELESEHQILRPKGQLNFGSLLGLLHPNASDSEVGDLAGMGAG